MEGCESNLFDEQVGNKLGYARPNDDGSVHDYPIDITKASRGLINIGVDPTNPRPVKVGSDFTVSGLSGTRPQAIAANANGKLFRDTQTIYHNPQSVQVSSVTGVKYRASERVLYGVVHFRCFAVLQKRSEG